MMHLNPMSTNNKKAVVSIVVLCDVIGWLELGVA
jgi:hypothetical protein